MDNRKFWMVWNPQANAPRQKHISEHAAVTEAERLATQHPGQRFFVLEAMCAREVNNMQRIDLGRYEELPF